MLRWIIGSSLAFLILALVLAQAMAGVTPPRFSPPIIAAARVQAHKRVRPVDIGLHLEDEAGNPRLLGRDRPRGGRLRPRRWGQFADPGQ